jgi:transposase
MGIERSLVSWERPDDYWRKLKSLCRERVALLEEKTMISNQLHALNHSQEPFEQTIKRLEKRIGLIVQQVKEVEQELKAFAKSDEDLFQKIKNVCTIKGVDIITAVTVVSECNGFANFHSKAQLVSYAGYDVVYRESGSSVNKTKRISKKGNRFIRRALHFPAQVAIQRTEEFTQYAQRIIDKTKIKMKGGVAIQRKLLVLIYKLFINDTTYDPNHAINSSNPLQKNRQNLCPA